MRVEKYTYRGFDEPHPSVSHPLIESEPEEAEAVLVSEQVLEETRKQAFEAGVVQGFHEGIEHGRKMATEESQPLIQQAARDGAEQALTSHHKQLEMTLGFLSESIRGALKEALEAETSLRQDVMRLALAMAQKLAGAALQALPLATIQQHITDTLQQCEDVPSLILRVSPDMETAVTQNCKNYAALADYRGVLNVIADPTLQSGDCRVEWQFGYAERRQASLIKALEDTIQRHSSATDHPSPENGA